MLIFSILSKSLFSFSFYKLWSFIWWKTRSIPYLPWMVHTRTKHPQISPRIQPQSSQQIWHRNSRRMPTTYIRHCIWLFSRWSSRIKHGFPNRNPQTTRQQHGRQVDKEGMGTLRIQETPNKVAKGSLWQMLESSLLDESQSTTSCFTMDKRLTIMAR